jgi:penicillin-binding protein 2
MVYDARFYPYRPAIIKKNVTADTAMAVEQMHLQMPGVRADAVSIRAYASADPNWSLSHIVGYTGSFTQADCSFYQRLYPAERVQCASDQEGQSGVEAGFDAYLHGINGRDQVEVDAGERPIRTLSRIAPVSGDRVSLTINWQLQQQVSRDLAAALQKLNLTQGSVVMEDVRTGQILASVSLPSYNSNLFESPNNSKAITQLLRNPASPLVDLATQGQLPPGSTFKVITAAAALETGTVDVSTMIDDTGVIKLCGSGGVGCQSFYGWQPPPGLGPVNVVGALAESSDIFFYTVSGGNPTKGRRPYVGANRLARWARLFGLGSRLGTDLPGESPGLIPSLTWYNHLNNPVLRTPGTYWTIGQTYNMGIGQGFDETTPLQMANVTATIANGGTLFRPRFVLRVDGRVEPRIGATARWHVIQPFVPSVIRRNFISSYNLALIQQGMHESVTLPLAAHGTSFNVTDPRIDAAGKTGTAQNPKAPHAWWIGYAPYNNPRVAIAVVVPYANSEGAYTAAPIAHKALEDYFHLQPTKANWLDDVTQQLVGGGAQ